MNNGRVLRSEAVKAKKKKIFSKKIFMIFLKNMQYDDYPLL